MTDDCKGRTSSVLTRRTAHRPLVMHKRKHRKSSHDGNWDQSAHNVQSAVDVENTDAPAPDPCLYIQAHEADVIRGPPAVSARSLEYRDPSTLITSHDNPGSALIRWGVERPYGADTDEPHESNSTLLWVDR